MQTKTDKKRIFNFLIDDLIKLKKNIKQNNKEEINIFFSYWRQHVNQLNDLGLNTNLINKL